MSCMMLSWPLNESVAISWSNQSWFLLTGFYADFQNKQVQKEAANHVVTEYNICSCKIV